MKEEKNFDVVIIGGGIAAMTAAIYGGRANLRCAVLESNITGGLVNSTYTVENFPSWIEIHGMELMEKVRAQVDHLGVFVEEVCSIENLDLAGEVKHIETDEAVFSAGAVILATGRKPVPLPSPAGDKECEQVHYCSICDGTAYKGKRILVLGGGNSAFDESLYLMKLGIAHITLIEIMDRFFAAQIAQDQLRAHGDSVDLRTCSQAVDLNIENGKLKSVVIENVAAKTRDTVPVDGIFVFLGQKPNTDIFNGLIELDKQGYIPADAEMRTSLPGVFSAGDVNRKTYRQITTAMADGTIAMLNAERYLRTLKK